MVRIFGNILIGHAMLCMHIDSEETELRASESGSPESREPRRHVGNQAAISIRYRERARMLFSTIN